MHGLSRGIKSDVKQLEVKRKASICKQEHNDDFILKGSFKKLVCIYYIFFFFLDSVSLFCKMFSWS